MRLNRLAFILSIAAGVICLVFFFYKLYKKQDRDFTLFVIGVFMIALGSSSYYKSTKNQDR